MIVWDGLVTYLILRVIKFFTPLRMSDAELQAGDIMVHGEVAYPMEEPGRSSLTSVTFPVSRFPSIIITITTRC